MPKYTSAGWRSEDDAVCVTIGANGRWVFGSKERLLMEAFLIIARQSEATRCMGGRSCPSFARSLAVDAVLQPTTYPAVAGNGITVDGVPLHRDESQLMEKTSEQDMMDQEEEDRLYLEQARERVLEHNRRVREAQRRVREARRPWREEQAQVWFKLNQRYERMLEHNRRVREAQAQRLRESRLRYGGSLTCFEFSQPSVCHLPRACPAPPACRAWPLCELGNANTNRIELCLCLCCTTASRRDQLPLPAVVGPELSHTPSSCSAWCIQYVKKASAHSPRRDLGPYVWDTTTSPSGL